MVPGDAKLSFDRTGRLLRVVSKEIRTYDAETLALQATYPLGGTVYATARDVLLVGAPLDGGDDDQIFSLVDMPSGRTSKLPSAWFGTERPISAGLSERGDRLSITETGPGSIRAVIYDTNRRQRIATVNANVGQPAGGTFGGEITADGRAIQWCGSRSGTCTVQDLDGGSEPSVGVYGVSLGKWRVELAFDYEEQQVKSLRVRDTATNRVVTKLDIPVGGESDGPQLYGIALCPGAERAVIFRDPWLYVVRLPDGKRLHTKVVGDGQANATPTLACAFGGTRAALALDGQEETPLIVERLPP